MPTVTLHHCMPVKVAGPYVPPQDVVVNVSSAGGSSGGSVQVANGGAPAAPPIQCPGPGSVAVPGATIVTFHYVQAPGGPESIEVEYEIL